VGHQDAGSGDLGDQKDGVKYRQEERNNFNNLIAQNGQFK